MSDKTKAVAELLDEHGFELVRSRKHRVYRNDEGKTFTTSSTPSDVRASRNQLSALKRELRAAGVDTSIDAEIPKQLRRLPGGSGPASREEKFYHGWAPRSVKQTPEQTLSALRGHLAARRSYEFKSMLVREFMKEVAQSRGEFEETLMFLRDNFDEAFNTWESIARLEEKPERIKSQEALPEIMYWACSLIESVVSEAIAHYSHIQDQDPGLLDRKLKPVVKSQLDYNLRRNLSVRPSAHYIYLQSAFLNIAGRAANRIFRGESSEQLKTFIHREHQKMNDEFPSFEIIERLACELIAQE